MSLKRSHNFQPEADMLDLNAERDRLYATRLKTVGGYE